MENLTQFEQRKKDHIRIALDAQSQTTSENRLDDILLVHEALPEVDLANVNIETEFLNKTTSPLFISSMTAGHAEGLEINLTLATAAAEKNWLMGVGSQRRQLFDEKARAEWERIRKAVPNVRWIGNIGIAQAIESSTAEIQKLVDSLQAEALFVHTNPIQEAFQPEGTPRFAGSFKALERLCKELTVPVILKETGSGFSASTLQKLKGIGLYAVDVAGLGGTHWGRVEGARSNKDQLLHKAANTFSNWGISTVDSILNGNSVDVEYELWGSGGVRNGLDAAKLISLGATQVGFAKVIMESALQGVDSLIEKMNLLEYELKVALFCTGCEDLRQFKNKKVWMWKNQQL